MSSSFRRFISFEGIDFSGKSTQIKRLLLRLRQAGLNVEVLREPGGTAVSERVREIVLDPQHPEMHSRTEILLYSAARSQLVHQVLLPKLQAGSYIIADRFFDSTTAYQGYGRRLDIDFVRRLNHFATSGLLPYKTLFIDVSPEVAVKRRQQAGRGRDRLEQEDLQFYDTIRTAFVQLADELPDRYITIDGDRTSDEVEQDIWQAVASLWEIS